MMITDKQEKAAHNKTTCCWPFPSYDCVPVTLFIQTYDHARGESNHFNVIHEIRKLINETTEFSCVYDLMCFVEVIYTEMEFKKMCILDTRKKIRGNLLFA